MSKPIFYERQQVGCLLFGEGLVVEMDSNYVSVRFNGGTEDFRFDGRYMKDVRPTLYPIEQYRSIIANLPAPQPEKWQPKPGEWCWFWSGNGYLVIEQFAEYLLPSKNYKTKTGSWYRNCAPFTGELPEHLKEVQP